MDEWTTFIGRGFSFTVTQIEDEYIVFLIIFDSLVSFSIHESNAEM